MKEKFTTIFLLLLLGIVFQGYTQQMPVFSQYKKNRFFFNPAVAGVNEFTNISLAARNQWMGFQDPPKTMVISGEGRILKKLHEVEKNIFGNKKLTDRNRNVGLGGAVFVDENAAIRRIGFNASYAYHIKLPEYSQLSFGLSFSGYQMKADRQELIVEQAGDPVLSMLDPAYSLDFSAGIFYREKDRFYTGLSFKNALQTIDIVAPDYQNDALRHYYLIGGYNFYLDRNNRLESYTIVQFNEKAIPLMQADFSLRLNHRNKWWMGLSYRTTKDLVIMGGVRYKNYLIGYSFDYGTGKLITHTYGSHEISIIYRLSADKCKCKFRWPDRF